MQRKNQVIDILRRMQRVFFTAAKKRGVPAWICFGSKVRLKSTKSMQNRAFAHEKYCEKERKWKKCTDNIDKIERKRFNIDMK